MGRIIYEGPSFEAGVDAIAQEIAGASGQSLVSSKSIRSPEVIMKGKGDTIKWLEENFDESWLTPTPRFGGKTSSHRKSIRSGTDSDNVKSILRAYWNGKMDQNEVVVALSEGAYKFPKDLVEKALVVINDAKEQAQSDATSVFMEVHEVLMSTLPKQSKFIMNDREAAYQYMVENFNDSWLTPTPRFGEKTSSLQKQSKSVCSSIVPFDIGDSIVFEYQGKSMEGEVSHFLREDGANPFSRGELTRVAVVIDPVGKTVTIPGDLPSIRKVEEK